VTTTYIAVDLETTGLDSDSESIIEIGAVIFNADGIIKEWSSLVNPLRSIPPFITELTTITEEMVVDAPAIFDIRSEVNELIADHTVVGHNVGFDLSFLRAQSMALNNRRLDTVTLASIIFPTLGRYGLNALATLLKLPEPDGHQAHRALDDARRTSLLFARTLQAAEQLPIDILLEIIEKGDELGWSETLFFREALNRSSKFAFGSSLKSSARLELFKPAPLEGDPLAANELILPIDGQKISEMLLPGGAFAGTLDGYEYREAQVEMLKAVANSLNQGQHLVVEAGTGTGKGLAYLLPAAHWATSNGRRVVVSTNTINLQDQLLTKDIPAMQEALPFRVNAALLKGRRNYVCTRRLRQLRHRKIATADEMTLFARLLVWLPTSDSGDGSQIARRTPGERLAWSKVAADHEGCRPDVCAREQCPLHFARKRAERAHILIVNHALLLADVSRQGGVLPAYTELIIDEAHHLEAAVTDGLSFRTDRNQIEGLLDEIQRPNSGLLAEIQRMMSGSDVRQDAGTALSLSEKIQDEVARMKSELGEFFWNVSAFLAGQKVGKSNRSDQIRLVPDVRDHIEFDKLVQSWENNSNLLFTISQGLLKLADLASMASKDEFDESQSELRYNLRLLARSLDDIRVNVDGLISEPEEENIYWIQKARDRISLHVAPLDVGPLVHEHIFETKEGVVLTSATLQTPEPGTNDRPSFSYIRRRLQATDFNELAVGSPFDYKASTLLYLPTDMPEPNQPGYQTFVEKAIVEVATALKGRTLVLFTSYAQLQATEKSIERELAREGIGTMAQRNGIPRQSLLESFKASSGAVLLGTRSFWEGVDVPGDALQAVVIVKLPFDVPSDPVFSARSETFRNPFYDYSIPEAALRFRQGFGRLIRRSDDRGVVVVLDKRVISRRYGPAFVEALPECTVVRQRVSRLNELTQRWMGPSPATVVSSS